MIRTLNESDHDVLMKYVKVEEEINLYIVGYATHYGYNRDFLRFWGEFDENDRIIGVLMKYYNDCVFYSRDKFDLQGFSNLLSDLNFQVLAGKRSVVEKFEHINEFSSKFQTFFCKLEHKRLLNRSTGNHFVKKMKSDKLEAVIQLYNKIDEFENNEIDNASLRQRIKDQCGRGFYIEHEGEVMAAVQTTAEYEKAAMIVSVASNPRHRRKGYTTACMIKGCMELLGEGKNVFLYYYNAEAGLIYHKMGFKTIEEWTRYGK